MRHYFSNCLPELENLSRKFVAEKRYINWSHPRCRVFWKAAPLYFVQIVPVLSLEVQNVLGFSFNRILVPLLPRELIVNLNIFIDGLFSYHLTIMINSYQLKWARVRQHLRCRIKRSFIFASIGHRWIIWAHWFVEPSFFLVRVRPLKLLLELFICRIHIISKIINKKKFKARISTYTQYLNESAISPRYAIVRSFGNRTLDTFKFSAHSGLTLRIRPSFSSIFCSLSTSGQSRI